MAGRGGRGGRSGGSRSSFGGRSSGGGFRSHGSRHGGMHHGHHHHHHHRVHFRLGRRRGYYVNGSGGCGGIFALLALIPFIIAFFVFFSIFFFGGSTSCGCSSEENVYIDESLIDEYTENQYNEKFASSSNYEDYALIVFLIDDEEYYDYYYCTWIGNHVSGKTANLLGVGDSTLNDVFESNIAYDYSNSIGTDLAKAIYQLSSKAIDDKGLTCTEAIDSNISSYVDNHTKLYIDQATINVALKKFEKKTGVKLVLVVNTINEVCLVSNSSGVSNSKEMTLDELLPFIIIGAVIVLFAIIIIASFGKSNKRAKEKYAQEKAEVEANKQEKEDPFSIDPDDY